MISAVYDANVLASGFAGFVHPDSVPGELVRAWRRGQVELFVSEELRAEVVRALRDPYFRAHLSPAQTSRASALLQYQATKVTITVEIHGVATHPEDDLVLAAAVSAKVNYLVTGDRKLQGLQHHQGVTIVSSKEFLTILAAQAQKVEPPQQ